MKLLIKERGSGKTTGLIYASEITGYPICVTVKSRVEFILQSAKEIGCNIPQPITVAELRQRGVRPPENILYDEVGEIIGVALDNYLGTHVICGVMSDYDKEVDKCKRRISV